MGSNIEIQAEILNLKNNAQDIIRRKYISDLAQYTKHDTIVYSSGFMSLKPEPPLLMSIADQDVPAFMSALKGLKGNYLDLIIHSPGGSLEATDQIVQYLRSKYDYIRAIIPQNAMSAATMLACACDEIVMGKHSAIGPIDPQVFLPEMPPVPAQAILDEFEMAKADVHKDPSSASLWVPRIAKYPHGFLTWCQNVVALSRERVAGWLDSRMLKGACMDEIIRRPIFSHYTQKKFTSAGEAVAYWLGDAQEHKTHARPIGFEICRELGLKVTLLEKDQALQERVLNVYHAMLTTHDVTNCAKFVENQNGKGFYFNFQPPR